MTTQEMVDRVKVWIVDRVRSTEESLDLAENIRDLCEEWIDALQSALDREGGE